MGEDRERSRVGASDGASASATAPRRRPPSTGLTLPLLAALIVGVIASFGVAIVGTLVTEPLWNAPIESGPYVTEPDGTMKLARSWIWPAPAEWGEPDKYQIQRNWLATRETATSDALLVRWVSPPSTTSSGPGQKQPLGTQTHIDRPYKQLSLRCGWPAPMLDVRDPTQSSVSPSRMDCFSWRFDFFADVSLLRIYPLHARPNGPVVFAREMPTRVYWPGLVFNTIFFGVLFLVMFILPGRAKIARRRRLGLCLACGYDLAGLAMCPECGLAASDEKPAHSAATPSPVP